MTITYTATYSPEDNKLRLYASQRLDADTFARVKAAGFKWAPKQGLFVAPMWTPGRFDLLEQLAGEVGDEDTSLVDRAEERAERFDGYQDRRRADSEAASRAAGEIAQRFEGGQPILVGHHSEKRARKDKERIDANMRRAVKMWDTADYWQRRAAGALAHAKYKELPTVRARRIKTLEAERRKQERNKAEAERNLAAWTRPGLTAEQARDIAGAHWLTMATGEGGRRWTVWDVLRPDEQRQATCPAMTVEQVQERARAIYAAYLPRCDRWLDHYAHRIAYERAMLAEQGAAELLAPKPRRALPPLLNYRAPGGAITIQNPYSSRPDPRTYPQVDMTKAAYAKLYADYRGCRVGPDKAHRFRTALLPGSKLVSVFLTDSKEHEAPKPPAPQPAPEPAATPVTISTPAPAPEPVAPAAPSERQQIDAMRAALRSGGVQVVAAPQLFPTPPSLAARVADLANVPAGGRVLEPSAGMGALLQALPGVLPFAGAFPSRQSWCEAVAVEIAPALARHLEQSGLAGAVHCADFLELEPAELGTFDCIVMNPPFGNAADIRHIEHARRFLKPAGRLVAICANGPRQQRALRPLAASWEALPAGSFKEAGTMVNAALLVIEAPAATAAPRPREQLALF